jgi:MFS superfamily sulfate permease-like transporter
MQVDAHLDERTFFCRSCEHTWSIDGRRDQRALPEALLLDTKWAPASDNRNPATRTRAVIERLRETLRRARVELETSHALCRSSQHRRHLRHLARLALRPQ